jgi:hypothetical protein
MAKEIELVGPAGIVSVDESKAAELLQGPGFQTVEDYLAAAKPKEPKPEPAPKPKAKAASIDDGIGYGGA